MAESPVIPPALSTPTADAAESREPVDSDASPSAAVATATESSERSRSPVSLAKPARSFLGLTRPDQQVLALLAGIAPVLMLWHWARLSGWGMRPVEIDRLESQPLDYRIDVNSATWVEWAQLDGIGETLAERIVEDRRTNGPFRTIDDLRRVKGIGPKTLEKIRPYLIVNGTPRPAN
jgi:competence protein ComEA